MVGITLRALSERKYSRIIIRETLILLLVIFVFPRWKTSTGSFSPSSQLRHTPLYTRWSVMIYSLSADDIPTDGRMICTAEPWWKWKGLKNQSPLVLLRELESRTPWLKVRCSTDWATGANNFKAIIWYHIRGEKSSVFRKKVTDCILYN